MFRNFLNRTVLYGDGLFMQAFYVDSLTFFLYEDKLLAVILAEILKTSYVSFNWNTIVVKFPT